MTDDDISFKDVKRFLNFSWKPSPLAIRRSLKVFKVAVMLWWIVTITLALNLRFDYSNNPELWHYIEGIDGEQLRQEEQANPPELVFGATQLYPDWVYETSKFKTIEHFTGLILGRVGLWFMFMFLLLAVKLRLTTWQLEYAREKLNLMR